MDESLRALEKQARDAPEDLLVGNAYVRALERAGEARRAFLELARLAREGDAAAMKRVDEWSPLPTDRGYGDTAFVPWEVRPSRVVHSETVRPGPMEVLAASDEQLLLRVHLKDITNLIALDARTLKTAWQVRVNGNLSSARAVGPDVLIATRDRLELRDARTGTIRREASIDAGWRAVAWGDRVILRCQGASFGVDTSDAGFGRELWRVPHDSFDVNVAGGLARGHGFLRSIVTGEERRWPSDGMILAMDADGAFLQDLFRGARDVRVTGPDLQPRWSLRTDDELLALTRDQCLLGEDKGNRVVALARDDGRRLWTRTIPELEPRRRRTALATGGLLHAVVREKAPSTRAGQPTLRTWSLESGETVRSLALEFPPDAEGTYPLFGLVPLRGALLLTGVVRGHLTVVRVE